MGLEDYKLALEAARLDWEDGMNAWESGARESAEGAVVDDAHVALLRGKMDRSLNRFIAIARRIHEEIFIKR